METRRRSLVPEEDFERRRSRVDIRRIATVWGKVFSANYSLMVIIIVVPFHSNPSCNLKNSRNAGSSFNDNNSLVVCCFEAGATIELRRSAAEGLDRERQIWARRPSS